MEGDDLCVSDAILFDLNEKLILASHFVLLFFPLRFRQIWAMFVV
jgi:hypothetical protein